MACPSLPASLLCLGAVAFGGMAPSASGAGGEEAAAPSSAILEWRFDGGEEPGEWRARGEAEAPEPEAGPRPPRYPGFAEDNLAARLSGREAWIVVKDHERGGPADIRFREGESITVEAWVRIASLGKGHAAYLVGKGRHRDLGEMGEESGDRNQNYAVRLQGEDGGARLGFLFASEDPERGGRRDWHRWWSEDLVPASGWHHVAVVYTFGQAGSLRAYIDGQPATGTWDMGGDTDLPPVVDADDLVIGTGNSRSASESFHGWMDNLAIHRAALPEEELASRYEFVPPPPPVTREMLTRGRVLMQISEKGVPEASSWPEEPLVTETYEEEVFGFFEAPHKYIATGVRDDRSNPHLLRASALVSLPPGKHRILLRGRGAARLIIDGERVLDTPFPPSDTGGHGLLSAQDEYLDLGPDFRFAPPGNREEWTEFESQGGEHFVVLETMVGGVAGRSKRRPELGETVAAVSLEGEESWTLLSPGERRVAYTDEGWEAYEAERAERLARINAEARAARLAEHRDYWEGRREAARAWLEATPGVAVPELPEGFPAFNEIDHFLAARVAEASAAAEAHEGLSVDYHSQVKPLLEARCYDCHQGGKAKGDLQMDRRESVLAGGEYDGPAVVPGDPAESSILFRVAHDAGVDIMPPQGDPLTAGEIALLEAWIAEGAHWPEFEETEFAFTPLSEDLVFLRRLSLDTVGVPPSEGEIETFLSDPPGERRPLAIDRYLEDPRWADRWMGYWQDVLAENPNIINPTLNNTGPFRWWIYESLLDNKPADLFVTELIRMEGSERFGGPAGFGTASQNDVPAAAKGMILSAAFLGVEMNCARCHDAPAHVSRQEDLFQIAAMLDRREVEVPETSSVPLDRIHQTGRAPLIQVTLPPGSSVAPGWPFPDFSDEDEGAVLAENPDDPRDRLAALVTSPRNERFAQVMANRIWARYMGRGIVPLVDDWERAEPSHPELLRWLGREFTASGYDMKALSRLILNSHAYQRASDPAAEGAGPLFLAPAHRRLDAEQIVDSLFSATGKPFRLEEVSLDIDSVRVLTSSITLGKPRRAWMLASTSNERDRPSLSLPRIQAVASVMETFGWRGARQDPISVRDADPNVLQPAILANGTMGVWLTRLSDDHGVTALALEDQPLERLLDRLFLQLLTREPSASERARYTAMLAEGYATRVVPEERRPAPPGSGPRKPERYVSWSNHLDGPANTLAQEKETAARRGDPPSEALAPGWRLRLEDVLWAMLNSPEWIYSP